MADVRAGIGRREVCVVVERKCEWIVADKGVKWRLCSSCAGGMCGWEREGGGYEQE